jgi:putative aldouronate transport system permease protein
MVVLQTGWLLGVGFDQALLMGNNAVMQYSDVLATYVMRYGIQMGRFSFATAAGIFQSLIGLILVVSSNYLAKKVSNTQIF